MARNKTTETVETSVCPVCMEREISKGLMCSDCYNSHKEEAVRAIQEHEKAESQLEFAIRHTSENLTEIGRELQEKMAFTHPFFSEAYKEVRAECQSANLRLEKAEFIGLVKARYHKILKKAGQKELDERVEWLKRTVHSLESKMNWFERLADRQASQRFKDKEAEGEAAIDEVVVA